MSHTTSMEILKQQNYQLKNEISQLKNAFDLNRQILKILCQQSKKRNPDTKIFYQIIKRLTTLNNQTMIVFVDLIHEKCQLKDANRQLIHENQALQKKIQTLINNSQMKSQVKQTHFQLRQQKQIFMKQILQMNQQLVLKDQQIKKIKKYLQSRVSKQPNSSLIQSFNHLETNPTMNQVFEDQQFQTQNYSKIYKDQSQHHVCIVLNNSLKQQNNRLTKYIQQIQSRLQILIKAIHNKHNYKFKQGQVRNNKIQQDIQLSLLQFAIQGFQIQIKQNQQLKILKSKKMNEGKLKKSSSAVLVI